MSVTAPPPPPAAHPAPPPRRGRPAAGPSAAPLRRVRGAGRRLRHLSLWSRQLFVLVRSGTPLAGALGAVERQAADPRWRAVLGDVRQRIDEGAALSVAMGQHPDCFDEVSRSLVAAGESSGRLEVMLDRIARLTRQQLRVRRTLSGALVYPCLLLGVAAVVLVLMIAFVFPRFAELFETLDAPLPPSTQALMAISGAFRAWWWVIAIAAVAGAAGLRLFVGTPRGRRVADGWLLAVPAVGRIARSLAAARLARVLGTLLESRVPMVEALVLCRSAAGNTRYEDLVRDAEQAVVEGAALSQVLAESPLVSASLAEAVRHGEDSGQTGPVLLDMADFMDEENETLVRTVTTIIEPVILIALGAVVAAVALSMFLPLFDLTSMT